MNAFSVAIVTKDFQPEKYESFTKILSECYSLTGSPASLLESYLAVATRGKCKSHDNGIFVSTEFDPRHAFVAASVKGESDVKINFSDARDRIFHLIWSKPYLLMPWLLKSPGHQQEWYWQYRISGFELNISKMGSWNHMGQTGNMVIKDFIRQMCVPLENSVYFDDGDGSNSNPEYATCTVAPLWIWSSSVEQNPRYYKRRQYDETLPRVAAQPQMTLSFFKPYMSPRWLYCDVMTQLDKTPQWAGEDHLRHGNRDNGSDSWGYGVTKRSHWWPLVTLLYLMCW